MRISRKRLAIACLSALGLAGLVLLGALEHRPDWYAPVVLGESELQQGRMDAMRVVDQIGDRLAAGNPFEITISQSQWNTWLAGLSQIWPDAAREIPREIVEPVLSFEAGRLSAAARIESGGWRAVITTSYGLKLSTDKEWLIVQLESARCGVVSLPRFVTKWLLRPHLRKGALRNPEFDQVYEGLSLENRFVWPNGRRRFRIEELTIEPGYLRLKIDPL